MSSTNDMLKEDLKEIIDKLYKREIEPEEAYEKLESYPSYITEDANIDTHRDIRQGFPEVIYCEGKQESQSLSIIEGLCKIRSLILATRASLSLYEKVKKIAPDAIYNSLGRTISIGNPPEKSIGDLLILTAGTSDLFIAEESVVTAKMLGINVEKINDVGVAGIHRLFSHTKRLKEADLVIVIAGMDGALASVVGGLVRSPVIAVPSSVGYGSSFGGVAALLSMLNSCASGVGVVNIDNGYGAAVLAGRIIKSKYSSES